MATNDITGTRILEACRMVDASKRNNKLLTIGYQSRYRVNSQYLKQMCEDGELGDIYLGRANAIRRNQSAMKLFRICGFEWVRTDCYLLGRDL